MFSLSIVRSHSLDVQCPLLRDYLLLDKSLPPPFYSFQKSIIHYGYKICNTARCNPVLHVKDGAKKTPAVAMESWKVCFQYLNHATAIACRIHDFDDEQNNQQKQELCRKLATLYKIVIPMVQTTDLVPRNASDLEDCAKW